MASPKAGEGSFLFATPTPVETLESDALEIGADVVFLDNDGPHRRLNQSFNHVANSVFEVEQLLSSPGGLPPPLSQAQREAEIRKLEPTATFEMLAQVPPDFLASNSADAQHLRRQLVRGATVVFVSAGYPGKRFILETAAALGVKPVVLDHHDSWAKGLVEEGVIAKFLPIDMTLSSQEIFEQAKKAIAQLGGDTTTGPVDGITTFVELSVPLTSRLCESFGLPGMKPCAVDDARDKHRTRAVLKAAGLPTPKNALVKSSSELEQAASHVGFPAVLKPVSGAASLGVKKVTSMQELQEGYAEVVRELGSLVISSGALEVSKGKTSSEVNAAALVDLTVLLEQYLDGDEVDVDVVMSDGEWRYAAVSDNGPTNEPYFNETWGLCPSKLPKEKQNALKQLAIDSCIALGFDAGIFHVELKYTSSGPQLIEVNARMGGGPVREVNRLVWGVDLVEEAIFAALGIPARPNTSESPKTCVAYTFVNALRSGKVMSTTAIEQLRSRNNVVWAVPLVKAGDCVVGVGDGMPTWIAALVVTGETPQKALDYALKLEAELCVDIQA
jgi:carnosine synthase